MGTIIVPQEFRDSYLGCHSYPLNHLSRQSYGIPVLKGYRERLKERRDTLFYSAPEKHKLPIRDISAAGNVEKINIFDEEDLRDFLGDNYKEDADDPSKSTGSIVSKKDARCRLIFFPTENAIAPLELDPRMLMRLMTYYQVMPQYLDFLFVYGSLHGEDREVRYSGFRTESTLVNPVPGTIIPDIDRTGRRYQICYNLKTVALKRNTGDDEDGPKKWKVRQAAIYHQFDVGTGTQLWMMGDPHAALKERISDVYHEDDYFPSSFASLEQALKSSLEIHLVYGTWATGEWRWHVRSLEDTIDKKTLPVVLMSERRAILDPGFLGDVQTWEDKTNETIMVLESNSEIFVLLKKFYTNLVTDEAFPNRERKRCRQVVRNFASQLDELIYDTNMQIRRARVLVKIVADRKTILIQHVQAQAAARAEELTITMYEQADRSANEAVAVRIVTIVTLIFLPATFVSTFFSTDVVKYQTETGRETFSILALERFFQVTVPLMMATFLIAGSWFWYEWNKRARNSKEIAQNYADVFARLIRKRAKG